jgi:anti-anti-sigma factor
MLQASERMDQISVARSLPALAVEVHTDDEKPLTLRLRGEVDIATVPVLRESLSVLVDDGGDVVVDLTDVDFIGLAGLEALCNEARRLRQSGDRLVVSSPSALARRVIDIIGAAELLPLPGEELQTR